MSWELYLPPPRPDRNRKTGRFMKGRVPANKGKSWDEYLTKSQQRRCRRGWKNLERYRPKERSDAAGRAKKRLVVVTDEGRFRSFECGREAVEWLGAGNMWNIQRCARQNMSGKECADRINTDHKYLGYRWYYHADPAWWTKIVTGL